MAHGEELSMSTEQRVVRVGDVKIGNTLPFVLGSDDTNNTAWFVSLRSVGGRTAETAGKK